MGSIDVQRSFHSMTLPPPLSGEHEWRTAIPIEPGDHVGIPIVSDGALYECPDFELLSDEEQDAQIREALSAIGHILHAGPQPLSTVIDLLVCGCDLEPRCAQSLFWRAHERGHLSLREGLVYPGRVRLAR